MKHFDVIHLPKGDYHSQKPTTVYQKAEATKVMTREIIMNPEVTNEKTNGDVGHRRPNESSKQPPTIQHSRQNNARNKVRQRKGLQSKVGINKNKAIENHFTDTQLLDSSKEIGHHNSQDTDAALKSQKHRHGIPSKRKEMRHKYSEPNRDDFHPSENNIQQDTASVKDEHFRSTSRSAGDSDGCKRQSLSCKKLSFEGDHDEKDNTDIRQEQLSKSVFDVKIKTYKDNVKKLVPNKKRDKMVALDNRPDHLLKKSTDDENSGECKYGSGETIAHDMCRKNMLEKNAFHPVVAMLNNSRAGDPNEESNEEQEEIMYFLGEDNRITTSTSDKVEQSTSSNTKCINSHHQGCVVTNAVSKTPVQVRSNKLKTSDNKNVINNRKKFDSMLQKLPAGHLSQHNNNRLNRRLLQQTSMKLNKYSLNNDKNYNKSHAGLASDPFLESKTCSLRNSQLTCDKKTKLSIVSQDTVEELTRSNTNQSQPPKEAHDDLECSTSRPAVCPRLAWGSPETDRKAEGDGIKPSNENGNEAGTDDTSNLCSFQDSMESANRNINLISTSIHNSLLDHEEQECKPVAVSSDTKDTKSQVESQILEMRPCDFTTDKGSGDTDANDSLYNKLCTGISTTNNGQIIDLMNELISTAKPTDTRDKNHYEKGCDYHKCPESLKGKRQTTLDKMKSTVWSQTQKSSSKSKTDRMKKLKIFSWKPLKSKLRKHKKTTEGTLTNDSKSTKAVDDPPHDNYCKCEQKGTNSGKKALDHKHYIDQIVQNQPNISATTEYKIPQNLTEMFAASNPNADASPTQTGNKKKHK